MNALDNKESPQEGVSLHRAEQSDKPVFIIDSDPRWRDTLANLLAGSGYCIHVFATAESFLASLNTKSSGVLVADLEVKRMSGLALQSEVNQREANLPVIFITGRNKVKTCVTAIKRGAFDILEKPVDSNNLLKRIQDAFLLTEQEARKRTERAAIEKRCTNLTPREREVMLLIVKGLSNRDIAERIGISYRTIEVHRSRVMGKMQADTLPDLVRQVEMCRQCATRASIPLQNPSPGC